MRHFHFKYIRNFVIVLIALVFAGYPYLLISQPGRNTFMRDITILTILLSSFLLVAYLAHSEHKKREKEEMAHMPEEPPSPRGY